MFNKDKVSIPNITIHTFKGMKDVFSQGKFFLCYSILLSIISGFSGQWLYSCIDNNSWWCLIPKGNIYYLYGLFGFYLLLSLFILFSFYFDLYRIIFKKERFEIKNIINFSKEKLRFIGYVYLYSFLIVSFIGISLKILAKEANPDWRIEFVFFIILFIFAWLPIIFIRMSSSIDYIADLHNIPFKKIWYMTSKRTFSIMITFCLMFLFLNFIHIRISYSLRIIASEYNYFVVAFLIDIIGCFLLFNYTAFLMMYFHAIRCLIDEKYDILNDDKKEKNKEQLEIIYNEKDNGKQSKKKNN